MANSQSAVGISFKLHYSLSELSFKSYTLEGSRIPDTWANFYAVERDDGLLFVAHPQFGKSPSSVFPGSGLIVTIEFAVLAPSAQYLDLNFERLQCDGQVNGYATIDYPVVSLASLQNVDHDTYFNFIFGDADSSGSIDIDDVVFLILYLFAAGPEPDPYSAGDFDRDSTIDLADIEALIGFIF